MTQPDHTPRRPRRPLVLALALIALAVACLSLWQMAVRVAEFRRTQGRMLYVFQPVGSRVFTYAGRPVSLTDHAADDGSVSVAVRYGDRLLDLPATLPPGSDQLPGLVRHQDWLIVLRFAERSGMSAQEFKDGVESGRIADRLVIVTRRPISGPDERSGVVPEHDWAFEFHEFLPGGDIRTERLLYPTNRQGRKAARGQLQDGTWEMSAALMLMPPTARPNRAFASGAVGAMGWTLPVAGFSLLILTLSLAAWAAPERRRSDGVTE